MCDSKATQMKRQDSQIKGLMLYEFKLEHNAIETIKNICCAKVESTFYHSTVTRWLKKFCTSCKNLNDHIMAGRSKTVNCTAMLQ